MVVIVDFGLKSLFLGGFAGAFQALFCVMWELG